MWPFWRSRKGLGEDAGYARTDVFFFVWRDERDGAGRRLRVLFPLWRSESSRNRVDAQSLTLIDGMFPANLHLRSLWAPLWRLWGVSGSADDPRHDILWGLLGWDRDGFHPPLSLSLD